VGDVVAVIRTWEGRGIIVLLFVCVALWEEEGEISLGDQHHAQRLLDTADSANQARKSIPRLPKVI